MGEPLIKPQNFSNKIFSKEFSNVANHKKDVFRYPFKLDVAGIGYDRWYYGNSFVKFGEKNSLKRRFHTHNLAHRYINVYTYTLQQRPIK